MSARAHMLEECDDVIDVIVETELAVRKRDQLGVQEDDIRRHGAVSEEVASQMAAAVRNRLGADIGIAITGVAGPGGGTPEKPVGLIWIAVSAAETKARRFQLVGDRAEIRQRAAQAALEMLRRTLSKG